MSYPIHFYDYKDPLPPSSSNMPMLSTHCADGEHQWC